MDRSRTRTTFLRSTPQSAQQQLGTTVGVRANRDRSTSGAQGSMLVWVRPGPFADAQAQWTAMMARGLETEVSLVDVMETPWTLSLSQAEEALHDRIEERMEMLRRQARDAFDDVPADCRVRLAHRAEDNVIASAGSERRDTVVLWGPVAERVIRALVLTTTSTVCVVRCPRLRPELPWTVGVADGDEPALSVARALVRGSREEASLHVEPTIDPDAAGEVPSQVVCVSRPTPGWWSSHVFRRQRQTPASKSAIIEVYVNEDHV